MSWWVLVLTAAWVAITNGNIGMDTTVHHWVQSHRSHVLDHVLNVAKQPGTRWVYFGSAGVAIAVGVLVRRSLRPAVIVAGTVALEILVVEGLKVAFGRGAPGAGGVFLRVHGKGFPSGHAANPLLALGLVGWWLADRPSGSRWWLLLGPVVSAVTGTAMLLLDYHWLTDNVAGWAIGALALTAAIWLDRRPAHRTWQVVDQRVPGLTRPH